jgi:hypothetical protein
LCQKVLLNLAGGLIYGWRDGRGYSWFKGLISAVPKNRLRPVLKTGHGDLYLIIVGA